MTDSETPMILSERDTPQGTLITVCDRPLLGETLENGDISLDVTESFYDGEPAEPEDVKPAIAAAGIANLVGTRAVELAVESGFVEEANVLDIDGERHAQILQL